MIFKRLLFPLRFQIVTKFKKHLIKTNLYKFHVPVVCLTTLHEKRKHKGSINSFNHYCIFNKHELKIKMLLSFIIFFLSIL